MRLELDLDTDGVDVSSLLTTAVVAVPTYDDAAGLMRPGTCSAGPPAVVCRLSYGWAAFDYTESMIRALPLAWGGILQPEGCDRAVRILLGSGEATFDCDPAVERYLAGDSIGSVLAITLGSKLLQCGAASLLLRLVRHPGTGIVLEAEQWSRTQWSGLTTRIRPGGVNPSGGTSSTQEDHVPDHRRREDRPRTRTRPKVHYGATGGSALCAAVTDRLTTRESEVDCRECCRLIRQRE